MELLTIRYVPNLTSSKSMDVGIVLFETNGKEIGFVKAKFITNMRRIAAFDPNADLTLLRATFREIEEKLEMPSEKESILRTVQDSFSTSLEVVGPKTVIVFGDPVTEVDKLSCLYLSP